MCLDYGERSSFWSDSGNNSTAEMFETVNDEVLTTFMAWIRLRTDRTKLSFLRCCSL